MNPRTLLSAPNKVRFLVLAALIAVTGCELASDINVGTDDQTGTGGLGGRGPGDDADGGDDLASGTGGRGSADDGSDDGSDGVPVEAVCGNGKLEPGELCDDGNKDSGDGCSSDCQKVDDDYICFDEGKPCTRVVTCGNGIIEGTEACDDKNTKDNDGCSAKCDKVEEGYSCVKPGEPCVLLPVCGNGIRERGEQCDDGNDEGDDGCSETCQQEDGYFCPPGQDCVEIVCGDGFRTPSEACDDNNKTNGDGCSSNCEVEAGWYCSASGCKPICGDGLIRGTEECDDANKNSGDGCSSACRKEPFYECDNTSGPSVCTSTIECGNGILEPGEICDPAIMGQSDCYSTGANACKGFVTILPEPVCGNGAIEYGEECDGDGGTGGCDEDCLVEDGFVCPKAGTCVRVPSCGDGYLQAGEECDPGAMSTVGCTNCKVNSNYFCSGQPSVCVVSICGDGIRAPNEQCDDGKHCLAGANAGQSCTANNQCPGSSCAQRNNDGCSTSCIVETGYVCPPNANCVAICGDGIRTGNEECDSPDTSGCLNCRLQPGYFCGPDGTDAPCTKSVCGNSVVEPGEGCDDGNDIAGDGCGPTCQLEPSISGWPNPVVAVTCGDGIKTGSEECDDGNTTDGDGCSSTCKKEPGWDCTEAITYPSAIDFKITYRDFTYRNDSANGGHPHMNNASNDADLPIGHDLGIVGPLCTLDNAATCGRLDSQGKPQLDTTVSNPSITGAAGNDLDYHADAFALWYRDSNATDTKVWADRANQGSSTTGRNVEIRLNPAPVPAGGDTLRLKRCGNPTDPCANGVTSTTAYQFSSSGNQFYPLGSSSNPTRTARGFGTYTSGSGGTKNWNFTSELRYYFQYKGGETLTFFGDDDVWVFVNGRLAVDIGGIHQTLYGRVVLGNSNGDCSVNGNASLPDLGDCYNETEKGQNTDGRFGITKGNVYEIVVFQAERRPTESNYQLTLDGFLSPRSTCNTICGDGIRAGSEVCDTGNGSPNGGGMPSSGYNTCLYVGPNNPANCTKQFCGDGIKNGGEFCDNGLNIDSYGTGAGKCAPGCQEPARCGDGYLQSHEGEECDNGVNNKNEYGHCRTDCKFAPYCGDGIVQADEEEECDPPDGVFGTYGVGVCGYDCKPAPYCGDGIRNGNELCDGTPGCNANCEFDPFCGDGLKTSNEECDYGSFNKDPAPYGGCTLECKFGPRCGDDVIQSNSGEECDDGPDNVNGEYDRCTEDCLLGPHCGDGIHQSMFGEDCDNGFNEDIYAYPGTSGACGEDCKAVPYCGDGKLQSAYELCDNGPDNNDNAYNGCTTKCEWGPYCGDGKKNGSEECDNGPKNVAYSADGKGCSYECKTNVPYCGDGVRNGPEQCDLGTSNNTGAYGGCKKDCTRAPYCGDRIVQKDDGEECDDGPAGSLTCTPTCKVRDILK
jgi:cysteine-rich repeat protein